MKITLKQLSLLNFKGQKSLTIDFNEQTTISGANATGKTTIFDAFTWVLFGKDSLDRTDFNIKTLDPGNKVIEKIPHEVEAVLDIDGSPLKLKRCYCEKWTRKRGASEEEFTGHETKYFVNGVEKSQKEYNEVIASICDEKLFKFITNPLYFPSQKKEVQREMLIRLAGDVVDNDIISQRQDFVALFAELSGKKLDDFKKELAAKKRALKDTLEKAPIQLEEVRRNLPEAKDWAAIESEIATKKKKISEIDRQIADHAKRVEAQQSTRAEIQRQIGALKEQRTNLEFEIKSASMKDYNEAKAAYDRQVDDRKQKLQSFQITQKQIETENKSLTVRKTTLEKQLTDARTEWSRINDSKITFNENDFICPTCKRSMEVEDVEVKQEEMRQNFNLIKANKLQELAETGKAYKANLDAICEEIQKANETLAQIDVDVATIEALPEPAQPEAPVAPDFTTNAKYIELGKQIAELEAMLNAPEQSVDQSAQTDRKKELQDSVDTLNRELAIKSEIEKGEKRIAELAEQIKANSQELSTLEKQEFTIAEFSKAKMEAVEAKTNGLFKLVKFKLFDTQINGGEVETCEAMHNGVPYSSQNNAMKINMGVDIINAICKKNSIYMPFFIDNAESINEIIPTESQLIRLVVTEDKVLTVK